MLAYSAYLMGSKRFFTKENFLALIFVSLSVVCHIVGATQFLVNADRLKISTDFFSQFFILLGLSFLLAIIVGVLNRKRYTFFIILFHIVVFVLIGYPLSDYLGVEFTLLTVVIVEVVFFVPSPYSIFLGILTVLLTLLLQRPVVAWGKTLPAPSSDGIISIGLYSVVILAFSYILKLLFVNLQTYISQVERMDDAVKQLMSANIGFQRYAKIQEETSKISERKRVTREIHDTIGYTLTNVIMIMEAITSLIKTDSGKGEIEKINELVNGVKRQAQEGLKDVRKALHLLREEKEPEVSGLRAISKIAKSFQEATHVKVNVDFGNMPWELSKECNELMYRLVQEGMTNAFRHGKATEIWIRFWQDDSGIFITIRDNGSGSPKVKKGIGLLGMTERVMDMGGNIVAHNVVDGFELSVWIPINENSNQ